MEGRASLPTVVGLDPGFASCGYAIVRLESEGEQLVGCGVIHTAKTDRKQHVLACDDNFRRAREIVHALVALIESRRPVAICAEAMSFPRQSSVAAKMAMTWGAIAALTVQYRLPLVQPTPQTIKKKLCGVASASKQDVQNAVKRHFDGRASVNVLKTEEEHVYDAMGAILASLDGEVLRMARQLVR
jgi:crossover junction endodeoxyribonuclease RuvC